MKRTRPVKRLNRADIVQAFSAPDLTRSETMCAVKRYMGDSPVPPAWNHASVRGVFGTRLARLWARHMRSRAAGIYRDAETGRWLHPVVQTTYDFGTTQGEIAAMSAGAAPPDAEAGASSLGMDKKQLLILDEYHPR